MPDFGGTDRFEIVRRLGSGGMGVVYEAADRERGHRVALKTIRTLEPSNLYRFKREFRALADIRHDNLVQLYELFSEDGVWFYTMELVHGVDLLHYVAVHADVADSALLTEPISIDRSIYLQDETSADGQPVEPAYDVERLRSSMGQLALAVHALHQHGKVHRDLKPNNVLVTDDGRVVLMDFGIVTEFRGETYESTGAGVVGTAAYMAPEQGAGDPPTPAADWYSVGIILYQALSGRLPFVGTPLQILLQKQDHDPRPVRELAPHADPVLAALCADLTRADPTLRPPAEEILARLGVEPADEAAESTEITTSSSDSLSFVGRDAELEELHAAFTAASCGTPSGVLITGSSGMGKTRLVAHFLSELRKEHEHAATQPLLLLGRCYRRETVPYRGFDDIVDSLSHTLVSMSRPSIREVLPEEAPILGRLFPVLRRVGGLGGVPGGDLDVQDPQELRARAFLALRDLLARLAQRRPVVLSIDDLHWAGEDSLDLLEDLMRPPGVPGALILATYRDDEVAEAPHLAALLERLVDRRDIRRIPLRPLDRDEGIGLALRLLGGAGEARLARTVWEESGGNPLFLTEICRYVQSRGGEQSTGDPDALDRVSGDGEAIAIDAVVLRRVETLDEGARHLLDLLAVAGEPLTPATIADTAGIGAEEAHALLKVLRSASLVRRTGLGTQDRMDVYHDRVRTALLEDLGSARRRQLHRDLAETMEALDPPPVELLATHWRGAGEPARAAACARDAAAQAEAKLAFDRASDLYGEALELLEDRDTRRLVARAMGDCLVMAGRNVEAGEAYLMAAEGASREEGHELRRLGAEHLITGGQVQRGMDLAAQVLREIGVRLPTGTGRTILSFLWQRLLLRLRGLGWRHRDARDLDAWSKIRCDTLWAMTRVLAVTQPLHGVLLSWKALRLALKLGEPSRVARMLLGTGAQLAVMGGRDLRRAQLHIERALVPVHRLQNRRLIGVDSMCRGMIHYYSGQWRQAVDHLLQAEGTLVEHCRGAWNEVAMTRQHLLLALLAQGQVERLSMLVDRYLRDARLRKDLATIGNIRSRFAIVWLARDAPDRALDDLRDVLETWPRDVFTTQHGWLLCSRVDALLYKGDIDEAGRVWDEAEPRYRQSSLPRIQIARSELSFLEGRVALALAAAGHDRGIWRPIARRAARRLAAEGTGYASLWGLLLDAGLARLDGDDDRCVERLSEADIRLRDSGSLLLSLVARRHQGVVRGDIDGSEIVLRADDELRALGVLDPRRMAQAMLPLAPA